MYFSGACVISKRTQMPWKSPISVSYSWCLSVDSKVIWTLCPVYLPSFILCFLWRGKLESWTLTASQRRRIEVAGMKLLRPLTGYTFYDHKTNDFIRRELQVTGILDKIDEYRPNWLSQLQRMPPNRIPLKSYHYRPEGRRTIGRSKKRWREQL